MATGTMVPNSAVSNSWALSATGDFITAITTGAGASFAFSDSLAVGIVDFPDITTVPAGEGIVSFTINIPYGNINGAQSKFSITDALGTTLASVNLGDTGFDFICHPDPDDPVNFPCATTTTVTHISGYQLTYVPSSPVVQSVASTWRMRGEVTSAASFSYWAPGTFASWISGRLPSKIGMIL